LTPDLASEFALGVLEAHEMSAAERRMRDEPEYCRLVNSWQRRLAPLTEGIAPVPPPATAWAAIQRRLGSVVPSAVRRETEGVWLEFAPGAKMKLLHADPTTGERTALLRMEPGSSCPAHDHEQTEECFVLEGSINIDGEDYRSGDYIIAAAGSRHGVVASVPGGLLLLHYNALTMQGAAAGSGLGGRRSDGEEVADDA
jgi:quercetin dioxygenase-like cupin family protein